MVTSYLPIPKNDITMRFTQVHWVLGEGNFVLTVSEGLFGPQGGQPTAFYDLFRLEQGLIVEHWDVIEAIVPREQWQNDNGKF
jgi:predicted SnoaL-like aldol condensation-catalyzing enzyme